MGNYSISNENSNVRTVKSLDDIKALSNVSDKTKSFLNSVFNELDTTDSTGKKVKDNILQENEGSIYVFDDGSVSITKNGKFYAGTSAEGAEARSNGDYLNVKFSDGSESVMKGDKLVSGKTNTGKTFTVKDGVITFDETENTTATKEIKAEKPQSSEKAKENTTVKETDTQNTKINGVEKQLLDEIAKEYLQLVRSNYTEDDKKAFFNKKLAIFKKALGKAPGTLKPSELSTYKPERIETDNFIIEWSPAMNMRTGKHYWEMYIVKDKRDIK